MAYAGRIGDPYRQSRHGNEGGDRRHRTLRLGLSLLRDQPDDVTW